MGCCKCARHMWLDPQEVIWKDKRGKGYCVFHAPAGHKNIPPDKFNDRILARIQAFKERDNKNLTCKLSATIFPHDIHFGGFGRNNPFPSISFHSAQFLGDVDFIGSTFSNRAYFWKAEFFESTTFDGTTFNKTATFSRANFHGNTSFENVNFKFSANFNNSHFYQNINFDKSELEGKLKLSNTTFEKDTFFCDAQFSKQPLIKNTTINGNSYFFNSTFSEGVIISNTTFKKLTSFYNVHFDGISTISKCYFNGPALFRSPLSINDLRFQYMNVEQFQHVDFLNTPLNNITFNNVRWLKHVYEERYAIPVEEKPSKLEAVAAFYRQMKKRCRDEQNDTEASLWHYAEKEAQLKLHRLEKPLSFQRFMLEIYRAISRYGEDPLQALEKLILFLILLLGVLSLAAFHERSGPQVEITMSQVHKLFRLFGQYCLFDKIEGWRPPGVIDFCVLFLSRLLIPIQAAIFAFALRNKLHR